MKIKLIHPSLRNSNPELLGWKQLNAHRYMSYNARFKLKDMPREIFMEKYNWAKSEFNSFSEIANRNFLTRRISTPHELLPLLDINLGGLRSIRDD